MPASAYESRKNPVEGFIFYGEEFLCVGKTAGCVIKAEKEARSTVHVSLKERISESLDMRLALLGKSGYSERPQTRFKCVVNGGFLASPER
jgi:hypothetical protein